MKGAQERLLLLCVALAVIFTGFAQAQQDCTSPKVALSMWRQFAQRVPGDRLVVRRYYPSPPTKDCKDAAILVEKETPRKVQLGEEYSYIIRVKNLRKLPVADVVYTDSANGGVEIVSSSPQGIVDHQAGSIRWELGTICPEETKTIKILARATRVGVIFHCGIVTYKRILCAPVEVMQIKLVVTKTMPSDAMLCETIPIKIRVRNDGTGTARNVELRDELPDGLVTMDGKRTVISKIGDLGPGKSKVCVFNAKATRSGVFENVAIVTGAPGLTDQASATVRVTEPILAIDKSAPSRAYTGSSLAYRITVTNRGDSPATNTLVTDRIPGNTKLVSASEGGSVRAGVVTWSLGTLPAGAPKTVEMRVRVDRIGDITNTATATAHCAKSVNATTKTSVEGIAAILMEVVDISDPIRVGDKETYVITVTNQGSRMDTNIQIVCDLEDSMELVSATGPTGAPSFRAAGRTVTFVPLRSLAPKAKAVWRVIVRAAGEADARFQVTMTSDQLKRPVRETEATNFYR